MVGKICTVCRQSSVANKNLSFFIYPGDRQRRYEWLKAVNRLDLLDKLVDNKSRGNHRICEAHFQDSFIKKFDGAAKGRKCLTKDAFPSLEHVNQAYLGNENSSNVRNKRTSQIRNRNRRNKVTKIDKPDNFVSVDMESIHESECDKNDPIPDMERSPEMLDEIKIEKTDDDAVNSNPDYTSPELTGFPDMSEFCESVIKVNKETQTSIEDEDAKRKKRKLDPFESKEHFIQSCSKHLSKDMVQLIKWQMNSKENGGDYKFHMFALNLYFSGASSYNMLKDMMGLPTMNTLKKLIVPKSTKFDHRLINALKIKVNNMSASERICSLSIGSIPIKPHLYYNITRDKVEGFHEIDGVQKADPAKFALVFMARGILERWAQLIAYAFISCHENSPDISIWVEEIITLLIDVGLDVRAFVSDPNTEILYMLDSQRVTPEKTYFSINDKNIYCIYDLGQLQKTVQSYLKSCHFYIRGSNSDDDDNILFERKLNELCTMFNTKIPVTIDPFNGAYADRKYQRKLINQFLYMLGELRVIKKNGGNDVTNTLKFIDYIQISIISIVKLYKNLMRAGAKRFYTSRFSHYSLNKFFEKTKKKGKAKKSKNNGIKKSSARQFRKCFSRCFTFHMMKKPIGDDKSAQGFSPQSLLVVGKPVNQGIKVNTTDYRMALPDKKRFETVCRYLYLKCIEQHSCDTFQENLRRCPESRQYVPPYRSSAPPDVRNSKLVPPREFTDFIMILEKRFRDYCKSDVKITSIGHQILKKISSFEFETPCQCFPLDYLKKLFIRLRIFYAVRENNIMYKKDKNKLFKTIKL